jgi:hypothetical protein
MRCRPRLGDRSSRCSFIRTVTVGSGIAPDLLTLKGVAFQALAGSQPRLHTAGGEFHPALRTSPLQGSGSAIVGRRRWHQRSHRQPGDSAMALFQPAAVRRPPTERSNARRRCHGVAGGAADAGKGAMLHCKRAVPPWLLTCSHSRQGAPALAGGQLPLQAGRTVDRPCGPLCSSRLPWLQNSSLPAGTTKAWAWPGWMQNSCGVGCAAVEDVEEGAQEGEKGCMPGPVERVKQCLQRKQTGPCATGTARPLCTAAVQMAAWLFWCCGNQSVSVAEQMPGA